MSSNTYEQIASELKLDFKHFLELYLNQSTSLEELDIIAKEIKDKWNMEETKDDWKTNNWNNKRICRYNKF